MITLIRIVYNNGIGRQDNYVLSRDQKNRDIVENREELIKKVEARRHRDLIDEALRARKFTAAETLAMGFDLIEFALKFREVTRNA